MKALIIDDDPDILEVVSLCFEIRWPEVVVLKAVDAKGGLETFQREGADIVILDLGLPDIDGLEVCRTLRQSTSIPIIILTVRDQTKDIVRGLEAGADDYVSKPFDQMEFIARAQAVLRRTRRSPLDAAQIIAQGGLSIDLARREVLLNGERIRLTPIEYNLLYYLASNAGKPVTHSELLRKIWGEEYADATEYLKVHVQHLRRKLGEDSANPQFIFTERGIGYKFISAPQE